MCSYNEFTLQQAVEEKYKLCDETLTKLLQWISEVEEKIASQDVVREVEEELRNQINTMKVVISISYYSLTDRISN